MEEPKQRGAGWHYLAGVGIVLAYVLGVGPANWLWYHTQSQAVKDFIEVFYRPLGWLADATPFLEPLVWYAELWE